MKINNNPNPAIVCWHNSSLVQDYWNEEYLIEGSAFMTQREVKERLAKTCPDYILVKDKLFHEGRRWFGSKAGSRSL